MPTKLPSFEVMAQLAKNDPQAFEVMRKRLTQDAISRVRDDVRRRRLQGLQFQIDMERRKSANPMAGCIRISQMMSESLLKLHEALNGLPKGLPNGAPNSLGNTEKKSSVTGAQILNFPSYAVHTCNSESKEE
jgi:hypothetical protein